MSTDPNEDVLANMTREEVLSALFANLVFQSTNMALMFMGRVPHPQTGEKSVDLEAARMFVDQLEMIEAKTKGNLSPDEEKLLRDSLTHLRMAFVESVQHEKAAAAPGSPPQPAAPTPQAPPAGDAGQPDDESRKKYSRKY